MIQKNLFLLEYMVKSRIEKDTIRLEAIRSISGLLAEGNINIDLLTDKTQMGLYKDLVVIKGKPLTFAETELIEEILMITK